MFSGSAELFQRERGRLLRLIERIVGCRTVAEDLAQDTFLKLHARPLGPDDANLLLRTGQNLAIDHLRAQRTRQQHAARHDADEPAAEDTPERHEANRRRLLALQKVLHALPVRTQRVFLMQRLDGLSYPKIAAALGVSQSTVEKDMIRAMDACRRHLADTARADASAGTPLRALRYHP